MSDNRIALVTLETVLGVLLLVVGLGCLAAGRDWPVVPLAFWQGVTYSGVALLAIGLLRDLYLLAKKGKAAFPERTGERPICVESVVGGIVVAAGLACLWFGVTRPLRPSVPGLIAYAGAILVVSGLIKDVVMVFKVEQDHGNVIIW